jgi:hypothetical protein
MKIDRSIFRMMAVLFVGATLSASLFSCSMATEQDYDNIANDMCGCFEELTSQLSPEIQDVIVEAAKNGGSMEAAFMDFQMNNPELAAADLPLIASLGEPGAKEIECIYALEEKYSHVNTTESEDEVANRMMVALEGKAGCEFTWAMMKIGLAQ